MDRSRVVLCCVVWLAVGWPLVSVHVTGSETVVRGGRIQLMCRASRSTATAGGSGASPRSVQWVKDGRRLSSEVTNVIAIFRYFCSFLYFFIRAFLFVYCLFLFRCCYRMLRRIKIIIITLRAKLRSVL